MADYRIFTDSSCDLPQSVADDFGLTVLPLTFYVGDEKYINYLDWREMDTHAFYDLLRGGSKVKTSAANTEDFVASMEGALQAGDDVLYLGFSSALSGTFNAGAAAARELAERYPERKVYAVDTLCASLGQGLFIRHCVEKKREGLSIDELRAWAEENRLRQCHWFTVDDLMFLKRGGRVSATTALLGTMLGIKPVMHMDDLGRLINMDKARGRKASIRAIADMMEKLGVNGADQIVYICHGDCPEDAQYLADLVKTRFGVKEVLVGPTGPVIGAHSGPGTLALFFTGKER